MGRRSGRRLSKGESYIANTGSRWSPVRTTSSKTEVLHREQGRPNCLMLPSCCPGLTACSRLDDPGVKRLEVADADRDLKRAWVASRRLGVMAHVRHPSCHVRETRPGGKSVGELSGAACCRPSRSADMDGSRARRSRTRVHGQASSECRVMGCVRLAPQRPHRPHALCQPLMPLRERDSDRVEVVTQPRSQLPG